MDLTLTKAGRRWVKGIQTSSVDGRVLGLLHEHGELSVDELSTMLRMRQGNVKSIVNKLHKKGLLRRGDAE